MKNKKPFQSKKFIALVVGTSFTTLFTLVGLIIIAIVPVVSSSVVNLMTISLASLNGIIGLYCVGQSAVDWKINSSHETTQENKIVEQKKHLITEAKNHEMKYEDMTQLDWDKVDFTEQDNLGDNFNFHINK